MANPEDLESELEALNDGDETSDDSLPGAIAMLDQNIAMNKVFYKTLSTMRRDAITAGLPEHMANRLIVWQAIRYGMAPSCDCNDEEGFDPFGTDDEPV
jgi:hypothetical protein